MMFGQIMDRIQPLIQGEAVFTTLPWVVAALCMGLAAILFLFVRIALIRRGHSLLTGTCNLYFYRELAEYYDYITAEGRSPWLYHTIRTLAMIAYLSIAVFIIGVFRRCDADQKKMGDIRYDVMEQFE